VGNILSESHIDGVPATVIGEITEKPDFVLKTKKSNVEWSCAELREGWETTIERAMARPGLE
jgi:hypothetical protein